MKIQKWILFALIALQLMIFAGCKQKTATEDNSTSAKPDFISLVHKWNSAHAPKYIIAIASFYNNTVLFYGSNKDKRDCMTSKLAIFDKYPNYNQKIYGDVKIEQIENYKFKCSFIKRVTINSQIKDYPTYLIFTKVGSSWKISVEDNFVEEKKINAPKQNNIPKNAINGDFNGDGILDHAWLVKPKIDAEGMDCIGDCIAYIAFSDPSIPSIKVDQCIGGTPTNLGDLNEDGTDEIGLLPEWFTSCWRDYLVWTFNNNEWAYAIQPFPTHCNQWDEGIKPIEIDLSRKGNVLIRFSEMVEDRIVTKTKSIRIR